MKPLLTVIICTHNPKNHYFEKVLQALEAQTLPQHLWEFLLIDNASDRLLSSEIDLTWHSQSRHIREDELGLTPARLRGIREAKTEILVFVDDDNVLDPDYLEVALKISKDYSFLGTWGGQTIPEFEVQPPDWTKSYWGYLAVREFDKDRWSNMVNQNDTAPYGAGLCVRKIVADKYADLVQNDSLRLKLGRKGSDSESQLLLACEDTDLSLTACDIGYGTGIFSNLRLKHLIPANRITKEYLIRLVEGTSYSMKILESFRLSKKPSPEPFWKRKLSEFYKQQRMHPQERPLFQAKLKAEELAEKHIRLWK